MHFRYKQKYAEKGEDVGDAKCKAFRNSLKTIMEEINSLLEIDLHETSLENAHSSEQDKSVIQKVGDELYAHVDTEQCTGTEDSLPSVGYELNRNRHNKHGPKGFAIDSLLEVCDNYHYVRPVIMDTGNSLQRRSGHGIREMDNKVFDEEAGSVKSSNLLSCRHQLPPQGVQNVLSINRIPTNGNDMCSSVGRLANVQAISKNHCSPSLHETWEATGLNDMSVNNKDLASTDDPAVLDFQFSRLSVSAKADNNQGGDNHWYQQSDRKETRKSMSRTLSSDSSGDSLDGNVVADSGVESDIYAFTSARKKVHRSN